MRRRGGGASAGAAWHARVRGRARLAERAAALGGDRVFPAARAGAEGDVRVARPTCGRDLRRVIPGGAARGGAAVPRGRGRPRLRDGRDRAGVEPAARPRGVLRDRQIRRPGNAPPRSRGVAADRRTRRTRAGVRGLGGGILGARRPADRGGAGRAAARARAGPSAGGAHADAHPRDRGASRARPSRTDPGVLPHAPDVFRRHVFPRGAARGRGRRGAGRRLRGQIAGRDTTHARVHPGRPQRPPRA